MKVKERVFHTSHLKNTSLSQIASKIPPFTTYQILGNFRRAWFFTQSNHPSPRSQSESDWASGVDKYTFKGWHGRGAGFAVTHRPPTTHRSTICSHLILEEESSSSSRLHLTRRHVWRNDFIGRGESFRERTNFSKESLPYRMKEFQWGGIARRFSAPYENVRFQRWIGVVVSLYWVRTVNSDLRWVLGIGLESYYIFVAWIIQCDFVYFISTAYKFK